MKRVTIKNNYTQSCIQPPCFNSAFYTVYYDRLKSECGYENFNEFEHAIEQYIDKGLYFIVYNIIKQITNNAYRQIYEHLER